MKVIEWPGGYDESGVALVANIAGISSVTFSSSSYSELAEKLLAWSDREERNSPASLQFTGSEVVYRINSASENLGNVTVNFTSDNTPFRPTANVGIHTMTFQVPAEPIEWWDAEDLPNGAYNFRGAIIEYHAYAHNNAGNFIGQIQIAKDDDDGRVTHSETQSGYSVQEESFWEKAWDGNDQERRLYYRGRPYDNEQVVVHWTAKVFYGAETINWYDY
jgi:hypothetical protein